MWSAVLCVLLCAGLALRAQKTPVPGQSSLSSEPIANSDEQTRITLDVTRVNILFTVTDKKGRFITDLGKDDFEVIESKKPQVIQQFTAESDLPLRIAVLIDTSNSIREQFRFEQEAAVRFMQERACGPAPGSHDACQLRQRRRTRLRSDRRHEETAKTESRACGREAEPPSTTPSYFASKEKLMMDQPRDKFRRAMIVISDGDDTESRYSSDQALEMAQKADVVIYAISTNIKRDRHRRRQNPALSDRGNRRAGVLSVQARRSRSIVREHRERTAAPVQHFLSPRAAENRWSISSGDRESEEPEGSDRTSAQGLLRAPVLNEAYTRPSLRCSFRMQRSITTSSPACRAFSAAVLVDDAFLHPDRPSRLCGWPLRRSPARIPSGGKCPRYRRYRGRSKSRSKHFSPSTSVSLRIHRNDPVARRCMYSETP